MKTETNSPTLEDTIVVVEERADTTIIAEEAEEISTPEKTKVVATREPLTLIISNLASATGPIIVGVYGTDNNFPDPNDQMKQYKFRPKGKELVAKISNLKFGKYALAIYQDENNDGKIDKNFIGIPTEGYAFSNNFKPTIKAPDFDDCSFDYNPKNNTVALKIIR